MTDIQAPPIAPPAPGRRTPLPAATAAVYTGQLARARVARGPLLFVATLQSLGILLLLRGVVGADRPATASAIVSGCTVLVVAFVALNLLAQRFGALRAASALDYYAALPIPPGAVVLGTAASYATFTVPGALVTAVVGELLYGLPLSHLWLVVPAVLAAGIALSGVGAALGLVMPRAELATVAGQLGMTVVLFLGVIPPGHLPAAVRGLRDVVPSTYAVDFLAAALRGAATWPGVGWRVAVSVGYGCLALAAASWLFRRAVDR
ncbi:MAG TPA: ABC transporter permease [Mycobacteriales bacterium]|nr:ABC transporter permease [Mycobacteriales bacterium]